MNLDSLNKWLMLAANLGVIAGIAFLAVELQQNNALLEAEARINQLNARNTTSDLIIQNEELAAVLKKVWSSDLSELTPDEEFILVWFVRAMFNRWDWQYQEYINGNVDEENLPVSAWIGWLNQSSVIKQEWDAAAGLGVISSDFSAYLVERLNN